MAGLHIYICISFIYTKSYNMYYSIASVLQYMSYRATSVDISCLVMMAKFDLQHEFRRCLKSGLLDLLKTFGA